MSYISRASIQAGVAAAGSRIAAVARSPRAQTAAKVAALAVGSYCAYCRPDVASQALKVSGVFVLGALVGFVRGNPPPKKAQAAAASAIDPRRVARCAIKAALAVSTVTITGLLARRVIG